MLVQDRSTQENAVFLPKIIRKPAVKTLTGLSVSTIWRLEHDGQFPRRISLGTRAVGWRYEEVITWLEKRMPKKL